MIIYKTTNLINGNFYIGQDSKNNPKYFGSGKLITYAIDKHGKENFKKEILDECKNKKELNEREIFWIDKLNPIYNITKGGEGGDTYSNNSNLPDIKNKISLALKRIKNEEPEKWKNMNKNKSKNVQGKNNPCFGLFGQEHPASNRCVSELEKNNISMRFKDSLTAFDLSSNDYRRVSTEEFNNNRENFKIYAELNDFTEEHCKNISLSKKNKYKNYVHIIKNKKEKFIRQDELNSYLDKGWTQGTKLKNYLWIKKDNICKRIPKEKIEHYLDEGWEKGRIINRRTK